MFERLYQRGDDGFAVGSDAVSRAARGPIPQAAAFLDGLAARIPDIVHGWAWSADFGRWGAHVTFDGDRRVFSFPVTYPATAPVS